MRVKLLIFFIAISIASFSQTKEERIGAWNIYNGYLVNNKSDKNELAQQYWSEINRIFPSNILKKYIKRLVLMTDGYDEKTGALVSLSPRNNKWQLVIDVKDVKFNTKDKRRLYESLYTLIHEFGHLITLNSSQIKPSFKRASGEGDPYITVEGEAYKNSYINRFVSIFWKNSLLREWDNIQDKYCYTQDSYSCVEKLYDLYQDNFSEFITDYAAESPEEDLVESWAAFVLRPKVKKPRTIAQKKINFFYQFPELVEYRKQILKNTRQYLH